MRAIISVALLSVALLLPEATAKKRLNPLKRHRRAAVKIPDLFDSIPVAQRRKEAEEEETGMTLWDRTTTANTSSRNSLTDDELEAELERAFFERLLFDDNSISVPTGGPGPTPPSVGPPAPTTDEKTRAPTPDKEKEKTAAPVKTDDKMKTKEPTVDKMPKEPTMDKDKGTKEPSGEKMPKEPTMEKMPKEPTMEKMPKEPTMEKMPKEPTMEKMPKEPTTEKMPKEPTTEKMPKEPTTEKMPKEPTMEKMPKEPTMDKDKSTKEPSGEKTKTNPPFLSPKEPGAPSQPEPETPSTPGVPTDKSTKAPKEPGTPSQPEPGAPGTPSAPTSKSKASENSSALCENNPGCVNLPGFCCPTTDGTFLVCCDLDALPVAEDAANDDAILWPTTRFTEWLMLSVAERSAASTLDYDEATWNTPGTAKVENRSYERITKSMEGSETALSVLNLNEDTWDCYMNHYEDSEWDELEEEVQDVYRKLGWTKSRWENDNPPSSDDLNWNKLSDDEQAAASDICYFSDNWNGLPLSAWTETGPVEEQLASPAPSPTGQSGGEPLPSPEGFSEASEDRATIILQKCGVAEETRSNSLYALLTVVSDVNLLATDTNSPQWKARHWLDKEDGRIVCTSESGHVLQRYIVALIYFSLNGPNWTKCSADDSASDCPTGKRWLDASHECDWFGLACDGSTDYMGNENPLTEITLKENNLAGELPKEMFSLNELTGLSMDHNKLIRGAIPPEIGQLSKLLYVEFDDNDLQGTFPEALYSMTTLKAIDLNNNRLTGTLSDDIGKLTELMVLQVEDNLFEGEIPGFSKNQELLVLHLHGNNFKDGSTLEPVCTLVPPRRETSPGYLQFMTADCQEGTPVVCSCCSLCF